MASCNSRGKHFFQFIGVFKKVRWISKDLVATLMAAVEDYSKMVPSTIFSKSSHLNSPRINPDSVAIFSDR